MSSSPYVPSSGGGESYDSPWTTYDEGTRTARGSSPSPG